MAKVTSKSGLPPQLAINIAVKGRLAKYGQGMASGLKKSGALLLSKSQELVPIDTGALSSTGNLAFRDDGQTQSSAVSYGPVISPETGEEYSVKVHEDLNQVHGERFNALHAARIAAGQTHARRPDEQAKFLERPAREEQPSMKRIIVRELKRFANRR